MEINGDRWVTNEHSLRDQQQLCFLAETIESSLSAHGALSERPTEISDRLARANEYHWMTKRGHQKCCVCWKIPERSLKDWWDRWALVERLKVRFPQRPLRDCFEPVQNLMETMGTIEFTELSLRNHGRPWRSLSAHWKTVERSVKFCGLSMVSQRSHLCGKGDKKECGIVLIVKRESPFCQNLDGRDLPYTTIIISEPNGWGFRWDANN